LALCFFDSFQGILRHFFKTLGNTSTYYNGMMLQKSREREIMSLGMVVFFDSSQGNLRNYLPML